jgi:DNA-binding Lrp family transcriptional regulator
MNIDKKDKKIISMLKENSRDSIRSIAKKTGIRPSTVHQRIQKLIKSDVIERFTIKLNNKAIGENFIVFMLIKGKTSQYLDQKILKNGHIKEAFGITGEHDMLLKLKFLDVEEFNDFIISFRKKQKGVQATLTMVATANVKEEI